MPFADNLSSHASAVGAAHALSVAKKVRYGCIAARINSSQRHRLGVAAYGRKPGTLVFLDVRDATRHPTEGEAAVWVCYHPSCAGKKWETRRELLAEHPEQRTLIQQQETHVYVAVCELPAVAEVQPTLDKDGKVTKEGRPAQPATVVLLSDEE